MSADTAHWEKVCQVGDIPDGGVLGLEVGETPVALVRTGGEVFALHDVCSHAEVRLSEGEVYDHTLECWLHGSCFDLRTGKPTGPCGDQARQRLPSQDRRRRRVRLALEGVNTSVHP